VLSIYKVTSFGPASKVIEGSAYF